MKKIVSVAFVLVLLSTTLSLCVAGLLRLHIAYASPYTDIDVETAYNMITNGSYPDLVILDVRRQDEYDSGHIYGAVWIPHTELETRISALAGHENHEIIVYCRTGVRSVNASETLDSYNFTKVYNMLGGITAWQSAGHEVSIAAVHNVNTTLNYDTIQAAIDAPQTLDGHTIFVEEGIYRENLVVNKSLSLIGEDRDTTILNETDDFVPSIDVEVDSVTIIGFTLEGWSVPNIFINGTTNVTINENRILFIGVGVEIVNSSNNVISGNIIEGQGLDNTGILVVESSGCIIENNTISGAVYDGIRLIWSADNNIITSNTISNNDYGIHILHSNSNTINNNMIVDNSNGIYIGSGNGTTIVGNTLSDNWAAISFSHSSYDNVICHNNFFNNTHQIGNPIHSAPLSSNRWDNGLEGNYWSDYTGQDANLDGIGDTPYIADGDNYPLMGIFSDFKATPEYHVQTICNSSISDFQFTGTAIHFNVTGENDSNGFCRVCIRRALINETYKVFVNGTEVQYTLLPCSNSTHSYLYFSYNHSTQEVIIVPEFPSWTSMLLLFVVLTITIAIYKRRLPKTPKR